MEQWEKYDVDMLLDIADSTNAPDENGEWYCEQMLDARDGWRVSIFYDCGELDYIDHFIAPDGEVISPWDWPAQACGPDDEYDETLPSNRMMAWRGVRRPETEEEKARREFIEALSPDERMAFHVAAMNRLYEIEREMSEQIRQVIWNGLQGRYPAVDAEIEAFLRRQENG